MKKKDLVDIITNKKGKVNSRVMQLIDQGKKEEIKAELLDHTANIKTDSLRQRAWHIINDVDSVPKCRCGEDRQFNYVSGGYFQYCSQVCSNSDPSRVEKIQSTKQDRYGLEYNKVLSDKSKSTNKEKYGVEYPLLNEDIREKTASTQQQKYGGVGFQSESIRQRAQESLKTKYGVASGNAHMIQHIRQQLNDNTDTHHYDDKMTLGAIANKYSVSRSSIKSRLSGDVVRHPTSAVEQSVVDFIKEVAPNCQIQTNVRNIIHPKEIDVWIPEKRLAVELNGMWYHSYRNGVSPSYHRIKTELCEHQGIRLIHLFETEVVNGNKWKDILSRAICDVNSVGARKCVVEPITVPEANQFIDRYHVQGRGTSPSVCYGLKHCDRLVSVMTFGKARFSKRYQWELLRLASVPDLVVSGGASKMFKQFKIDHRPQSVVSYCDVRLFTGSVYSSMEFQYSHRSNPNYYYFHMKDPQYKMYHRVHFQKHKLEKKLDVFDSTMSEWQNMLANNWNKIYDCGHDVWVYQ